MTLEEVLEDNLKLKEQLNSINDQLKTYKDNEEVLKKSTSDLSIEVTRLQQKNYEYLEKLSTQFEQPINQRQVGSQQSQTEDTPSIDDVVNSFLK